MPSFDVVSQVDLHALGNAVDQANRIVSTRFDFKGADARFTREEREIEIDAPNAFQLEQMEEMLRGALSKCDIDSACLSMQAVREPGGRACRTAIVRHGLDQDACRALVRRVKDLKLKVQSAVQGDMLRVTGKKRDDLQQVMTALQETPFEQPLQFVNRRD